MIRKETMSILIVDDMENMCRSIRGMLKVLKYGSTFRLASNGLEALNLLKKEAVDMAIVDWNMPVMTGVELLSRIRKDLNLRDLPVVMVTAEANREIVAEAAESDIDAYILKPLTVKSLGDRIADVIDKINNPPAMHHHLRLAREFEETGDRTAAIEEVKHAMDADPNSTRPMRELGRVYMEMDNFEEAEKWLSKAAELNDLDVLALHLLGELHLRKNDVDGAAEFFDQAMNISPRHVSRGVQFGRVLLKKGMPQKALGVFNKAINLSNDSTALQEEIADYCMEHDTNEYAANLLGKVLDENPARHDLVIKLGQVYENMNNPRKALSYFIEAAKQDKNNIDVQVKIAKNYIDSGQVLRAEQVLNTLLQKDPEHPEAQELLKRCL